MWDSFVITRSFTKFTAYWNRYGKRGNKANTRHEDLLFSHNQKVKSKLVTCMCFKFKKSHNIPIRFNSIPFQIKMLLNYLLCY